MLEVFVLVGFLGSGKTTLLRNFLERMEDLSDTAVIINEFGQVGIDGRLLVRQGLHMVELVNGCVCCSLMGELSTTLSEIISRKNIRRVFIEATGLAEPISIISILQGRDLAGRVSLRGVISVLDARLWKVRKSMGPFFLNQLKDAAVVILNKIDLVGVSESSLIISEMARELPISRVLSASYGDVDLTEVTTSRAFDRRDDHFPQGMVTGASLASEYSHLLFNESLPFDSARFEALLQDLSPGIVRAKGLVRYPGRTLLLNFSFGEASWEQIPGKEGTCLEFIGKRIDEEALVKSLRACLSAK